MQQAKGKGKKTSESKGPLQEFIFAFETADDVSGISTWPLENAMKSAVRVEANRPKDAELIIS